MFRAASVTDCLIISNAFPVPLYSVGTGKALPAMLLNVCIFSGVLLSEFHFCIVDKFPDFIRIIFLADKQDVVLCSHEVAVQVLDDSQLAFRHENNVVLAIIQQRIAVYNHVMICILG